MKEINDYTSSGSNQVSAFYLTFIEKFWENFQYENAEQLGLVKGRENYFALNRALNDALQKHLAILSVEYVVNREEIKATEGKAEEYVLHKMAHNIAEKLLMHEGIPYRRLEDPLMGNIHYKLQVPFLVKK